MTTKSREYIRELSPEEQEKLKERYKGHIKPVRKGILNPDDKNLLLQISRWSPHTPDQAVYDFFYNVRERTKSALLDLQLICDILNEEQLQLIFGTKQKFSSEDLYPVTEVLSSLLPSMSSPEILQETINQLERNIESAKIDRANRKNDPHEVERYTNWIKKSESKLQKKKRELPEQEKNLEEQKWRKFILEDVALHVLQWYFFSGLFQTDSHKRMIIDVMDAITIMSSGKKRNLRRDPDQTGIETY